MELQQEPRKKRFRLVKLEERVVPSHLGAVFVPPAPGIDVAQAHQPHLEFAAKPDFTITQHYTARCTSQTGGNT